MRPSVLFPAALCLCFLVAASLSSHDDFERRQRLAMDRILYLYRTNSTYAKLYDQWEKEQGERVAVGEDFPCPLPKSDSDGVPTSVHRLHPRDIKVIGAVGDSLTAGRGASLGPLGLLLDFPELSWSIGGRAEFEKQITLPNIIRKFNPETVGAAQSRRKRVFNKARSGAKADEMLNQTIALVDAIKADKHIDFENDWKVVTVFIGGNDICAICDDYNYYSPENYQKRVQDALDYLQDNLPRTFVNLVELLNVEMVQELGKNLLCEAVHMLVCECANRPGSEEAQKRLLEYKDAYQQMLRELGVSKRYRVKDDFTVVLQPFYRNTYPPFKPSGELDLSYFASDCFHLSSKGQQAAAKALWNNMIEPLGSKRLDWHPYEPLECPSKKSPYLATYKNSK
ncbi:phospholipase B1, membrane-associated [Elysia marginata]|uniref:Phospholipase B1, membrane-associated n=1 Tax=Elysia marginata TaxID=1093978 RepID=A0AAV4J7L2_9GAST|nr:phospholipase B1, membrane-associated [Elysia marginata]